MLSGRYVADGIYLRWREFIPCPQVERCARRDTELRRHDASRRQPDGHSLVLGSVYIPASVTSLPKNVVGVGTLGTNRVNGKQAYTPPCSKGPGPKEHIYTVYALSAEPQFSVPASQVDRVVLLDAIKDITLDSAELHVIYSRK